MSYARKLRMDQEATVGEKLRLPKCWLADLIHSQMASGNFAKMAKDAIDNATRHGRHADKTLYTNMLDQVGDYYAQRDQ